MNKERKVGIGILIAGALVALVIMGILAAHEARSLKYTAVFEDAKGLQVGDRVQLNGVDIGVVKNLELFQNPPRIEVLVRIDPDHALKVRSDSTARIRNIAFPNVSGQMIVEVLNSESKPPAPEMADGAVIHGVNSLLEYQTWKIKKTFTRNGESWSKRLDQLGDTLKDVKEEVKEMATSPQVREALESLQGFMKNMKDQGRDAVVQLKEEWPEIRDKIEPVLKELTEYGREHLVKQVKMLMRQIEETLQRWSELMPAPSSTPADNEKLT